MKILILGGDKRYEQIIKHYKNHDIDLVGYINSNYGNIKYLNNINIKDYDIIIFPINGVLENYEIKGQYNFCLDENFLVNSKKDVIIFSGIKTKCLNKMLIKSDKKINLFMEDKEIVKENSIITTEGILGYLINNTNLSIKDSEFLIIGYGNIGKILVDYLKKMNGKVAVCINKIEDLELLNKLEIPCFYYYEKSKLNFYFKNSDFIINTAPFNTINESHINKLKDTLIIDVASYPFGIDEKIKEKVNYVLLSALPSKVAHISSGKILLKKIDRTIGDC